MLLPSCQILKVLRYDILFGLLALFSLACTYSGTPKDYATGDRYDYPEFGYSIVWPKGWIISGDPEIDINVYHPKELFGPTSTGVGVLHKDFNAKYESSDKWQEDILNYSGNPELILDETTQVGELQASRIAFKDTSTVSNESRVCRYIFFSKGKLLYCLSSFCLEEDYEELSPTFEKLERSLTLMFEDDWSNFEEEMTKKFEEWNNIELP